MGLNCLDGWGKSFAGSAVGHEERVLDHDAAFRASQPWNRIMRQFGTFGLRRTNKHSLRETSPRKVD